MATASLNEKCRYHKQIVSKHSIAFYSLHLLHKAHSAYQIFQLLSHVTQQKNILSRGTFSVAVCDLLKGKQFLSPFVFEFSLLLDKTTVIKSMANKPPVDKRDVRKRQPNDLIGVGDLTHTRYGCTVDSQLTCHFDEKSTFQV